MMTYEEAKEIRDRLESEVKRTSATINEFKGVSPVGKFGLTADYIKISPEYETARAKNCNAFERLRAFNAVFVKRFAKELRAERRR